MALTNCTGCGVLYQSDPSRKRKFCGRACWAKWKTNRDHHGVPLAQPAVERPCDVCSKTFRPLPAQAVDGFGRYCSRKCAGRGRRKASEFDYKTRMSWYLSHGWTKLSLEFRAILGECELCGGKEDLEVHHVVDPFPTRDVVALLDRKNLTVTCRTCHRREHVPPNTPPCEVCSKVFRHPPSHKRRFCSIACRDEARRRLKKVPA